MADTSNRGFASMDDEKQRKIASEGGKAAHEKGTAHEFSSQEAARAGRKGGETVSQDTGHMADIGRKGGEAVSEDTGHMADIGRKGGEASHGGGSSGSTRGGTSAQHREAGRQSHKNT